MVEMTETNLLQCLSIHNSSCHSFSTLALSTSKITEYNSHLSHKYLHIYHVSFKSSLNTIILVFPEVSAFLTSDHAGCFLADTIFPFFFF